MRKNKSLYLKKREYDRQWNTNEYKVKHISGEKYCGRNVLDAQETSLYIQNLLLSNQPMLVSRFGGNELNAMVSGQCDNYPCYFWDKHKKNVEYDGLFYGAGFFPKDINLIPALSDILINASAEIDLLGVWYNKYEDLIIDNVCQKQMGVCGIRDLEPYSWIKEPWTQKLIGKKVLVIHPFAESIQMQYQRRMNIFPDGDVLPQFDLQVMKAVQTIAWQRDERFGSWFEALEFMYEQTMKCNFDIAIIGCGAYGLPLGAKLKQNGKQVIHLGGATQMMFGIWGSRWENDPVTKHLRNEYWVRPLSNETPEQSGIVEGGCYW